MAPPRLRFRAAEPQATAQAHPPRHHKPTYTQTCSAQAHAGARISQRRHSSPQMELRGACCASRRRSRTHVATLRVYWSTCRHSPTARAPSMLAVGITMGSAASWKHVFSSPTEMYTAVGTIQPLLLVRYTQRLVPRQVDMGVVGTDNA